MAGVVAHGTWTARKAAPKLAEEDDTAHSSSAPYSNAVLVSDTASSELHIEPVFSATQFDSQLAHDMTLAHGVDKKTNLDPLIDVISVIQLETVISGDAALAALPAWLPRPGLTGALIALDGSGSELESFSSVTERRAKRRPI